jgi:peptidyl-prolyl cis-trans isomerase C
MALIAVFVFLFIGTSLADDSVPSDVVLEADGIKVTEMELSERIKEIRKARDLKGAPPAEMVRQIAVAMFKTKAMAQAALRKGLEMDPDVVKAFAYARQQILASAILGKVESDAKVPDFEQAAKDYYDAHVREFRSPTRAMVSHILLKLSCDCVSCDCLAERAEKAKEANEVLKRLQEGEDFTRLAREVSDDKATAALAGSLGAWITKDSVDPRFAAAAFALQPGELSGVVATKLGFHIIKMDKLMNEEQISFEDVKAKLMEMLRKDYKKRIGGDFVVAYEKKAEAGRWNEEALERLSEKAGGKPEATSADGPPGAEMSGSE